MPGGPVVGIAGASYVVTRPFGDLAVHGIPRKYVEHVVDAGGRPVILPPRPGSMVLDVLDALVLTGGGDLEPALYGPADCVARDVDHDRDDAEIAMVRWARDAELPVLGICRGIQVFAVVDGGTLVRDLGPHLPHVVREGTHPVTTAPGSACAALLGLRPEVSSLHHQSVESAGAGWLVTARADDDVVEALEWDDPDRPWPALGVQWHPELDDTGPALFGWLVERARRRVPGRASYELVP